MKMKVSELKNSYDVLIVGSGIAGLYAALNFPPTVNILMLSKKERHISNSSLAQGGVACVLDLENDSYDFHFEDTSVFGIFIKAVVPTPGVLSMVNVPWQRDSSRWRTLQTPICLRPSSG